MSDTQGFEHAGYFCARHGFVLIDFCVCPDEDIAPMWVRDADDERFVRALDRYRAGAQDPSRPEDGPTRKDGRHVGSPEPAARIGSPGRDDIQALADAAECAHDANMAAPTCPCPCHRPVPDVPPLRDACPECDGKGCPVCEGRGWRINPSYFPLGWQGPPRRRVGRRPFSELVHKLDELPDAERRRAEAQAGLDAQLREEDDADTDGGVVDAVADPEGDDRDRVGGGADDAPQPSAEPDPATVTDEAERRASWSEYMATVTHCPHCAGMGCDECAGTGEATDG